MDHNFCIEFEKWANKAPWVAPNYQLIQQTPFFSLVFLTNEDEKYAKAYPILIPFLQTECVHCDKTNEEWTSKP